MLILPDMPKTFYIFRHGTTYATKTATAYGDTILTASIMDEAKSAIERIGEFLKDKHTDFNVTSPIIRCAQTAEIISKITGKKFVFDNRLTEYTMESHESVDERINSLLLEIEKKDYKNITICTHGAIISILINRIMSNSEGLRSYDLFHFPDPGVLVIIKDNNIEEINFN